MRRMCLSGSVNSIKVAILVVVTVVTASFSLFCVRVARILDRGKLY